MSLTVDQEEGVVRLGQETFQLPEAMQNVAKVFSVTDSGLMVSSKSGIIYHRSGFGSEQIVYQFAPGFRLAGYGQYENDPNMKIFDLPFPWTYCVIAYEGGNFKGVRHYYSPTQIQSLDQPLYAPNLPNTNTRGYNTTSVGWVCLYLKNNESNLTTLIERLNYALGRYDSLGEPYNYGNMSSTDGYTLYKSAKPTEKWLWQPEDWQKKGKKDGLDWVLDEGLWIPFTIPTGDDGAKQMGAADAPAYTLRRAMFDTNYVYYRTQGAVQLNEFTKADAAGRAKMISENTRAALLGTVGGAAVKRPPAKKVEKTIEEILDSPWTFANAREILNLLLSVKCMSCYKAYDMESKPIPNFISNWGSFLESGLMLTEWIENKPARLNGHIGVSWMCDACIITPGKAKNIKLHNFQIARGVENGEQKDILWRKPNAAAAVGDANLDSSINYVKYTRGSGGARDAIVEITGLNNDLAPAGLLRHDLVAPNPRGYVKGVDGKNKMPSACQNCKQWWAGKYPKSVYGVWEPDLVAESFEASAFSARATQLDLQKNHKSQECMNCAMAYYYDLFTGVYVRSTSNDMFYIVNPQEVMKLSARKRQAVFHGATKDILEAAWMTITGSSVLFRTSRQMYDLLKKNGVSIDAADHPNPYNLNLVSAPKSKNATVES